MRDKYFYEVMFDDTSIFDIIESKETVHTELYNDI